MPSKSLKASVTLGAEQVEDAIVYLSDRYLKATKTSCRVVQTPTDFCLVDICKPLIERWISNQVRYSKGKITLIFRSGEPSNVADMVIYAPTRGDRFLYTRPRTEPFELDPDSQLSLPFEAQDDFAKGDSEADGDTSAAAASQHPLRQLIERQAALEAKLDQWLNLNAAASAAESFSPEASAEQAPAGTGVNPIADPETLNQVIQPLKEHLTRQIRDNLTAAFSPLLQRLSDLQDQISDLSERIDELEDLTAAEEELLPPQTQEEWQERIEQTWGTVGDYERYSFTYREANAETPLHETPDWVVLCELEWARELCPALIKLHHLVHSPDGIGYDGADILQQFGQHLDAKTGEPYYVYQYNGFSAYEALSQIAYNSEHSWLPELKRLWVNLAKPDHEVFQLFGWEPEAIAALKSLVAQSQTNQGASGYSWDYRQSWQPSAQTTTIKEYRAILNLSPFTPITMEGIRRAYREAMKAAHPDIGGTTEYAQRVNEAYEAVLRHYFPEASS